MRQRSRRWRTEIEFTGLRLGQSDEVGHGFRRQRGMSHQQDRSSGNEADGGKVTAHVITWIGVERRIDRGGAAVGHDQGIAIGRSLGPQTRPYYTAGSAAIIDNNGLSEC